ncbi:MAG: glucose-6-phosphate dehydrogenase [Candidatus Goldiibacteriota bacterium HGW-Goldbacteria-1]|jgi:glucose-6-phosphate 1-dehydrogenase|nr:MAG: glucose-6-phosphate dehydrogenase [Candidatus Goldiibacteriota bacterium HGW-Goldbacteria-1]
MKSQDDTIQVNVNAQAHALCEIQKGLKCGVIIPGASGDLTYRKLLPSLYNLYAAKRLPEEFFILGYARTVMDNDTFRKTAKDAVLNSKKIVNDIRLKSFLDRCNYISGGYDDKEALLNLKKRADELAVEFNTGGNLIVHMATPSEFFGKITKCLYEAGLIKKDGDEKPFIRVMYEKPFGRDKESAKALNIELLEYLSEKQIYRIDHYLGKETVQNILVFRFANMIFEPVWNSEYIDNIQITFSEDIGVEHRAGYYEKYGALRDIFQNHMLQLAALIGMEHPAGLDEESIRSEKMKFFKSITPFDLSGLKDSVIMGQYAAGNNMTGYRQEQGVNSDSCVETYFALKMFVDNKRWEGVPFYIRAGKRLKRKTSQIAVVFKKVPSCMFCREHQGNTMSPNILVFGIQPEQGVNLTFQAKTPGSKMCLAPLEMKFNYNDLFGGQVSDDYETLILDCMQGDRTLFWTKEGLEISWQLLQPVLEQWEACRIGEKQQLLHMYQAGSWGPEEADMLIEKDGRKWIIKE